MRSRAGREGVGGEGGRDGGRGVSRVRGETDAIGEAEEEEMDWR